MDDDPVYYELVEVRVNGEPVPNGVRAPELLLRKQSYADLGLLINGDTDDPPVDTGDDLGLDLWQSQVIYVRQ